ncbi:hypothetical protein MKY42_08820 [Paenibacillus sp. FSL W7-1088]
METLHEILLEQGDKPDGLLNKRLSVSKHSMEHALKSTFKRMTKQQMMW